MFCTNCGARVEEKTKFCPVCGNKLEITSVIPANPPQNIENLINKSTYESVKNNENLIDNSEKKDSPKKEKKSFSSVFSNFKSKKSKDNPSKSNPNVEAINDNTNFNNQTPNESLSEKIEYEEEIPPSYYGYNPTDDRKRKDLRNRNTSFSPYPADFEQKLRQRDVQTKEDQVTYEPASKIVVSGPETYLSAEQRIAERIRRGQVSGESQTRSNINNDIPNEYLEARIARSIQRQKGLAPQNATYANASRTASSVDANKYQAYDQNQNVRREEVKPVSEETVAASKPIASDNEPKPKKEGFKFKPIYLLPLLLILLALGATYFFMNRKPKETEIDLTEYIDVNFTGDDGAATPSASINSSKLLADHANDIAYVNKKRKDDTFGSAANQFIDELEKSTTFQFSKDANLSNGEEITAVANISDTSLLDDYNVMFTNTIKSVIVDGLITQEYVDPFQYINVEFEGEDPNITLRTTLTEDAPEYMSMVEIAPSKTGDLKAGEEVNVSLQYDEESLFNSYGLRLDPREKMFQALGESTDESEEAPQEDTEASGSMDGFITSIDSLDEELLGTMKYKAGQLIRNTFNQRSFTEISDIKYLGAITGSDTNASDLKNRVMLVYEIKAKEDYEGRYQNEYTYYTFVEYQNVKDSKDESGNFYTEGPITTDNEIFHKFFVEDDYTYYEIPYYGFAFLEEVITRVNNALSGLTIDDSIATDVSGYFETSDGVAGEYQGNGTRLSLKSDGTLKYQLDQRVHQGQWQDNSGSVTLTIEGVNVDTPINATFENGLLNVAEQGEMKGQTFNKMQAMN